MKRVVRFRVPHDYSRKSATRTSEPNPHYDNKLPVSFDYEVRNRGAANDANFGTGALAGACSAQRLLDIVSAAIKR